MCEPQYFKWSRSFHLFESLRQMSFKGRKQCSNGNQSLANRDKVLEMVKEMRTYLNELENNLNSIK